MRAIRHANKRFEEICKMAHKYSPHAFNNSRFEISLMYTLNNGLVIAASQTYMYKSNLPNNN